MRLSFALLLTVGLLAGCRRGEPALLGTEVAPITVRTGQVENVLLPVVIETPATVRQSIR